MQAQITVSYNQLCVFDPKMENPYNDWNAAQTEQGFSWRPGSVSFATEANTAITIEIQHDRDAPETEWAATVIRVPFHVPTSGVIEIGSILSGVEFSLSVGSYALYFLQPSEMEEPFVLRFVPSHGVQPAVLKESATAKAQQFNDMDGSAA